MYHLTVKSQVDPNDDSHAQVTLQDTVDYTKVVEWLQKSFSYMNNPSNLYKKGDRKLTVKAVNLKDKSHLLIDFENDLSEGTCDVKIQCPNMELASDVV